MIIRQFIYIDLLSSGISRNVFDKSNKIHNNYWKYGLLSMWLWTLTYQECIVYNCSGNM